MSVSPKKVFTFYMGLLMQRSIELSPGYMPNALPKPPLIDGCLLELFLGLSFSIDPLPEIFLPTLLGVA